MQGLENLGFKGKIELYYADKSHVYTDGYAPYGWWFKDENVYIPLEKNARLNIFCVIPRRNQYKDFTTKEFISADKLADYLDRFSFEEKKKTEVLLDNASAHGIERQVNSERLWEDRGLFLFYLPSTFRNLILQKTYGAY